MLQDREIAEAIGQLCDGGQISGEQLAGVRAALKGAVLTERGLRLYYADLNTMLLSNVDTEEGLWSTAEDGIVRGGQSEALVDLANDQAARAEGLFPLAVIGDSGRMTWWQAHMQHASNAERRRWARFVRRVLKPLLRAIASNNRIDNERA